MFDTPALNFVFAMQFLPQKHLNCCLKFTKTTLYQNAALYCYIKFNDEGRKFLIDDT